ARQQRARGAEPRDDSSATVPTSFAPRSAPRVGTLRLPLGLALGFAFSLALPPQLAALERGTHGLARPLTVQLCQRHRGIAARQRLALLVHPHEILRRDDERRRSLHGRVDELGELVFFLCEPRLIGLVHAAVALEVALGAQLLELVTRITEALPDPR